MQLLGLDFIARHGELFGVVVAQAFHFEVRRLQMRGGHDDDADLGALFGGADMGAVVPFVLWFNFVAGFSYLLAGIGLWRGTAWAPALSIGIAAATAVVFVFFLWHVWRGGAYESRTMAAMVLRLGIWVAISTVAVKIRWPR